MESVPGPPERSGWLPHVLSRRLIVIEVLFGSFLTQKSGGSSFWRAGAAAPRTKVGAQSRWAAARPPAPRLFRIPAAVRARHIRMQPAQ